MDVVILVSQETMISYFTDVMYGEIKAIVCSLVNFLYIPKSISKKVYSLPNFNLKFLISYFKLFHLQRLTAFWILSYTEDSLTS